MLTLQNDTIKINVKSLGAELCSIFHKEHQLEYMWQAGPEWTKHSPLLFPIVGQLSDNYFNYQNKRYELPRHGFAREKFFSLIEQESNRLVFRLSHDEETIKVYPFYFNLEVEYALQDDKVIVSYLVENTDKGNLYFSIGAHPAFKVPLYDEEKYNDYKLLFDDKISDDLWPLKNGLIGEKAIPYLMQQKEVPLTKELFSNDALVFKNFGSSSIEIKSKNHTHGIKFNLHNAPYLGLWAAKGANFICIEPWHGIADSVNSDHDLISKEGIISLVPNDVFAYKYSIQVF